MTNQQLLDRVNGGSLTMAELRQIATAYTIVTSGTETYPQLGIMVSAHIATLVGTEPAPWPPATPVVPTITASVVKGLKAITKGSSVELTWPAIGGATSYDVMRRTPETDFARVKAVAFNTAVDVNLANGQYTYCIVAKGPGCKVASNTVSVTIGKATTTTTGKKPTTPQGEDSIAGGINDVFEWIRGGRRK